MSSKVKEKVEDFKIVLIPILCCVNKFLNLNQ